MKKSPGKNLSVKVNLANCIFLIKDLPLCKRIIFNQSFSIIHQSFRTNNFQLCNIFFVQIKQTDLPAENQMALVFKTTFQRAHSEQNYSLQICKLTENGITKYNDLVKP